MRVAVTGGSGFVGRWLVEELESAGHVVVPSPKPRIDIADAAAVHEWFAATRPHAVAHLAAIAAPRDVAADPDEARRIAVDGTRAVIDALATVVERASSAGPCRPVVLVSGSSEVYGRPASLPFVETMAVDPVTPYGRVKAVQESVALEHAQRRGIGIVVTRSFNHIGPGQRTAFAVPAFAARIIAARRSGATTFPVGNLDVRRDLTDVRDVAIAYRLLLERASDPGGADQSLVVNVGSGRAVLMSGLVATLIELAGGGVEPRTEASLVRDGEVPEIVADVSRLRDLTGWRARIGLDQTLADILDAAASDRP